MEHQNKSTNLINRDAPSLTHMSVQKQPGDRPDEKIQQGSSSLEEPKKFPTPTPTAKPAEKPLVDYKGFKLVPEPERKTHHPLVEAAITLTRLPFKVLVEWPMDALDRLQQRFIDRRNQEIYDRAERDQRLRRMFPPPEKKKGDSEK